MQLDNILSRLDKVKKSGKGFIALCPVHTEKTPSMHIEDKGGKIVMYCFGCGANGDSIAPALGLKMTDLFADSLTPRQNAQHQVDALARKIQEYDTLIEIYEYDMQHSNMTEGTKSRYRDLIASRIDCINHKQNLQNKYGIN